MSDSPSAGFLSGRTGQLVAAVFAVAGVGLAGWTLFANNQTEARRLARFADRPSSNAPLTIGAPPPGQANTPLPPPAETEAYTFAPIKTEADVTAMMDEFAAGLQSRARATPEVAALGQKGQSIADAARASLEPFLLGSMEQWLESVKRLGGDASKFVDSSDKPRPFWARLSGITKFASLDLTKATIHPARSAQSPMAMQESSGDGPARARPESRMAFRPGGLYPDIEGYEDKKLPAFEVRVPIKPKDSKDDASTAQIGITLVWNEKSQTWQPADYSIYGSDPATMQALMAGLRKGKE